LLEQDPSWFSYFKKAMGNKFQSNNIYAFILSVSIHLLIFSLPEPMIVNPKMDNVELFFSIIEERIPPKSVKAKKEDEPRKEREIIKTVEKENVEPAEELRKEPAERTEDIPIGDESKSESAKTEIEAKKIQTETVREWINPIRVPEFKIEKLNMSEPFIGVKVEQIKEFKKEMAEKVKIEPGRGDSNPASQPSIENKDALSIPTFGGKREIKNDFRARETLIGIEPSVGKLLSEGQKTARGETVNPIETRFGDSIAPCFLHRELPRYPMVARRMGKEGKVVLRLTIDEKGNLLDVEVLEKAGYGFTEAAVEAVKKSTFLPAKKDGKPIACQAILPIRFQLKKD